MSSNAASFVENSVISLTSFIFALLTERAADELTTGAFDRSLVLVVAYLIVSAFGFALMRYIRRVRYSDVAARRALLEAARQRIDRSVARDLGRTRRIEPAMWVQYDPLAAIFSMLEALHETLRDFYREADRSWRDPRFEATFMTMAEDNHITIEAWANEDHQMPFSMTLRPSQVDIYKDTETAKVYAPGARRQIRIVEDTMDSAIQYDELYENELVRLRSAVIYPVLASDHRLLGTVVVHCNHPFFFRRTDVDFWSYFMAIFARLIAREKVLLEQARNIR